MLADGSERFTSGGVEMMDMAGASIVSIVFGSLALFVGAYYLLYVVLTGEKRENLAFSLTCFAATAYDVFSALIYNASSALESGVWQRGEMIALDMMGVFILWFVADYTGRRPGRIEYAFWAYWAFEIVMWLVSPPVLMATPRESVKSVALFDLSARRYELFTGVPCQAGNVVMLLALAYMVWRLVGYYRAGQRERAAPALVGFVGLSVALVNAAAVDVGLYDFFHVLEHAYMFFIVCMAYSTLTAQIRTRAALHESQAELASIFRAAPAGIGMVSGGVLVHVNDRMIEMTGYSQNELIGRNARSLYGSGEEFNGVGQELAGQVRERVTGTIETRWRRKDGSAMDVLLGWAPLEPQNPSAVFFYAAMDITARRQAEEETHRLAAAVNAAAESIVITDARERILYVNPSFERLTGYSQAEAIGRRPSLVKSGKHERAFYQRLRDTIMAGNIWSGRFTNRKKDGALYNEAAVISPVRDDTGRIVNFVAVKRDVTQELLLEDELRQSQKMEAVGRMAERVAHDFTNMLVIIRGNAELAKERLQADREIAEFLDSIIDTSNRACKLTSQLLAFSHRQPMILRQVDLGRTVLGLEEMLRRTLQSSIKLGMHAGCHPCTVRADPDHLEQIVVHMAINASDAMPEKGALTIEVSLAVLSKEEIIQLRRQPGEALRSDGAFGVLSVSDTGCGMTPEMRPHLFESFYTTKGSMAGAGLGLPTVYGIVEQHEGAITVYSKPGMGTTFRVYLRLIGSVEQERVAQEKALETPTGNETILLADDDPFSRGLLVGICQSLGYSVLETEDLAQTLGLVAAHPGEVALLLVDYGLLKTSEGDPIGEIRKKHPDIKVALTSGFTRRHLIDSGAIRENDPVLCWPYQLGVAARMLHAVLTGRSSGFTPLPAA
ncbi:MAG: PAS domain S-box protein [Verrucomicrobiota bacterium]|nr:PAS domain S-box protein [Verrucomicrobiota bacterium]